MFEKINQIITKMDFNSITPNRKVELEVLRTYIQYKKNTNSPILLHFICTHNSRRSQFSQLWAQVASNYYNIPIKTFSGGVEITAFNERAIHSLKTFGFEIEQTENQNPIYSIKWSKNSAPLKMHSKLFDDKINPTTGFAAIMTCSHADENCPFIPGCEKRIPLRYDDPKFYDDSPLEKTFYQYRSFEIATELFYIFSKIK